MRCIHLSDLGLCGIRPLVCVRGNEVGYRLRDDDTNNDRGSIRLRIWREMITYFLYVEV